MVFLILLALAVGGAVAFFLLLVGLFEAPWPLLLITLVIAFGALQRLSVGEDEPEPTAAPFSTETEMATTSPQDAKTMGEELVYRGIRYTHIQTSGDDSEALEGTYRGQHWRRPASSPAESDISDEIVYRGHRVKKPHSDSGA